MAHLGDKGILGVEGRKRARLWIWSCRAWAVWTGFEGGRLGRELILRGRRRRAQVSRASRKEKGKEDEDGGEGEGEKETKLARIEDERRWWREVGVNAAYAPMTLHWSFERGMLGDGVIGVLGIVAGGLELREAWRKTG